VTAKPGSSSGGHLANNRTRIRQRQNLHQLVGDAFARQAFERLARGHHRGVAGRIKIAAPEARRKAIVAQDAQMILGDPRCGIANKAHAAAVQIGNTAEIVIDCPGFGIGIERIDREIAPRRIVVPLAGESDHRAAAVGFDIVAQRRDLVMIAARDRSHGAMRNASRNHLYIRRLQPPRHLVRQQWRRQVDVGHRQRQQRVAHRAADDLHRPAIAAERRDDAAQPRPPPPFGIGQHAHRCQPAGIRRARLMMIPAVTPQIRRPCQSIS
jgi:hypothetical protein